MTFWTASPLRFTGRVAGMPPPILVNCGVPRSTPPGTSGADAAEPIEPTRIPRHPCSGGRIMSASARPGPCRATGCGGAARARVRCDSSVALSFWARCSMGQFRVRPGSCDRGRRSHAGAPAGRGGQQSLRRQEHFAITLNDDDQTLCMWVGPQTPMQFIYSGNRRPLLNRLWLEQLADAANSTTGLGAAARTRVRARARAGTAAGERLIGRANRLIAVSNPACEHLTTSRIRSARRRR